MSARFIDRIGKGIRGAPRDALVADLAPVQLRGACFGLRQAFDTVGAFLGPLLAMLFMWGSANQFRLVFWVAVLPAFLSLLLILVAVREPARGATPRRCDFLCIAGAGASGPRLLVGDRDRHRVCPGPL